MPNAYQLAIWVLDLLLGCQQSVVLLPLTSMTYTPFCSIMNVPSNRKYGACIHKWASAGIPYGIPMLVGGGLIGVLVKVVLDLNTSNESEVFFVFSFEYFQGVREMEIFVREERSSLRLRAKSRLQFVREARSSSCEK